MIRTISVANAAALSLVCLMPAMAEGRDATSALKSCGGLADGQARLACFDALVAGLEAPTYQGRLSLLTEPFELKGPAKLRFHSDGAIFVLYLKAADGTVLQNLHIGGGGEDSYRIESAGTYRLQINGSESWRVWVEPENAETN